MKYPWIYMLGVALLTPAASAAAATATAHDDVQHSISLTLSPIHLVVPIVEVTGEYRLSDKAGVALIGGVGSVTATVTTTTATGTASSQKAYLAYEAGVQGRYYLLGSFIHGMQVGAEVLYVHIGGDVNDDVSTAASGLGIGPFIGYKIASNVGFTFDAQLGAEYLTARGKAASSSGQTASARKDVWIPLLNLNIGWSF